MSTMNQALLRVHIGYICMSFTAVIVALSSWPPFALVCARMWIGGVFLGVILWQRKAKWKIPSGKERFGIAGTGVLLVVHWVTFFASIRAAGIPVAAVTVATIPMFSALLEPLLHGNRPERADVLMAVGVFLGICLLTESFSLQDGTTLGIALGLLSAACKSLRDILSRSYVQKHGSILVMFYHLIIGGILLLPWLQIGNLDIDAKNLALVFVIGTLGTGIAHTLTMSGLHQLRASSINTIGTLTVIYQIVFGIIFAQQIPSVRIVLGGSIVLAIAFIETRRHAKS